jgi:hypothetical protein
LVVALRALYLNHRHSTPGLQTINTFLLAFFIARIVLFCFVFGGFHGDVALFVGVVGLSISLNGGVRRAISHPATKTKAVARSIKLPGRLAPGMGH